MPAEQGLGTELSDSLSRLQRGLRGLALRRAWVGVAWVALRTDGVPRKCHGVHGSAQFFGALPGPSMKDATFGAIMSGQLEETAIHATAQTQRVSNCCFELETSISAG